MGDIAPSTAPSSRQQETQTTPITHIVLFKYAPSTPWTELQAHFDAFLALPAKCIRKDTGKPYMASMKAGKNMSWEDHAKGMTHGFVLEFRCQADLDYYLTEDPVHLAFSKAARTLVQDSVVVDIHNGVLFGPSPAKPKSVGREYKGSCHCGEVEWTAKLDKAEHILCHCSTCQKLGGGPYSLNAIIPQADLRILRGNNAVKIYRYVGASGKEVRCYYCGNCTSHVYHHQEIMGDQIIVRTILLDGGREMGVGGEIFEEGRLGWVGDLKGSLPL